MVTDSLAYLDKAIESLAGAESEYANKRYNNCANRCYYAMFQAAIAALIAAGIRPRASEHSGNMSSSKGGLLACWSSAASSTDLSLWRHLIQSRRLGWRPTTAPTASARRKQAAVWPGLRCLSQM